MAYKRSRKNFEDDHSHAPFAVFGTPLPDEDDRRDDNQYLPVWKQEVRDERGRKRLHGAFTGGFSAGYFNTVGSKEGWTPSTFTSSRSTRRKEDPKRQQRAEDYMDDEDLDDAAEAQKIQTTQSFAGLGSAFDGENRGGGLAGLFRASGDTKGLQLMRKMGWKEGQGVGPRIRRKARLDMGQGKDGDDTHLFAPDNVDMIKFVRKSDRKGLGHEGERKLSGLGRRKEQDQSEDDDEDDDSNGPSLFAAKKKKAKPAQRGIGVGVLNDNGSDEEDPYEMGPKIKYNRVMGGDKKKKSKKSSTAINPALKKAPTFVSRAARSGNGFQRCHDGRLPLDGFVLAKVTEDFANLFSQYAPPAVPQGWKSSKEASQDGKKAAYVSAADAAKASTLDARSRAALLGEKALPGKSVFDFMSSSARDKLAAATGNANLPAARGEIPNEYALSEEDRRQAMLKKIPTLERETAAAALARSVSGGPYADNEARRSRYRAYLEHYTNTTRPLPEKLRNTKDEEYVKEMNEYFNCARIFKPMSAFMTSRFTTGKTVLPGSSGTGDTEIISDPGPPIVKDEAEEAAKMGMFGRMTRKVEDFYPTRLLCKRFNVRPPAHSQPDGETKSKPDSAPSFGQRPEASGQPTPAAFSQSQSQEEARVVPALAAVKTEDEDEKPAVSTVDPERNEAVEGKTAHADVLKAIFGDSDSE